MPRKDVYLFNESNDPLQVKGIRIELFDATTGTLLDAQNSEDLNPGPMPSNEWGVRLTFTAGTNPLDIYITDPTYCYPGNTIRNLNGQLHDRIWIDLLQLPTGPGGQTPPTSVTPSSLSSWVKQGWQWSTRGKKAVGNLIFNYISVIVPRIDDLQKLKDLYDVAQNWEEAMSRLGIRPDLLKK